MTPNIQEYLSLSPQELSGLALGLYTCLKNHEEIYTKSKYLTKGLTHPHKIKFVIIKPTIYHPGITVSGKVFH